MANFNYRKYTESDNVKKAKTSLDNQLANAPGAYQSAYTTQLNDTLNKINNREPFSYDLNADPMYQMYKDSYIQNGKLAAANVMGQAASLTGGYGNSYAATVGNQAFQQSLAQLNDRVPELYQMAMNKYQMEGDDLRSMYSILADREGTDYSRYRDTVGDYQTELARLTDAYNNERQWDYGLYSDDYGRAYDNFRANIADEQDARDYAESVRQFNENLALDKARQAEAVRQYNEQMAYQRERDAISDQQYYASLAAKNTYNSTPKASAAPTLSISDKDKIITRLQKYKDAGDRAGAENYLDTFSEYDGETIAALFTSVFGTSTEEEKKETTKKSEPIRHRYTGVQEYR